MERAFFRVVSVEAMRQMLMAFAPLTETENVPLEEALGRVCAHDITAPEDLPARSRSAMDGYAVCAQDTFGASESLPAYLELAGTVSIDAQDIPALAPGTCMALPTGASLPAGADAVVMVEHTQSLGSDTVEIRRSVAPGDNVLLAGEDVRMGAQAISRGTRLRAQDLGLLAALGVHTVPVVRRPRVAVLSTGDELVPITAAPRPGQIRDVNGPVIRTLARQHGGLALDLGLVRDDETALRDALCRGLDAGADLLCISGGSSVGVRDLTVGVLEALGAQILAHGVAMAPGKPTIVARWQDRPVLGLPGQMASAFVVLWVLGIPLLRHLSGEAQAFAPPPWTLARLTHNIASKPGREEYVRVRLVRRGNDLWAQPVNAKSGLLRSLLDAHGLVRVDDNLEGMEAGATVPVILWDARPFGEEES
jgi:molybdopterin molybdotransferase